MDPHNLDTCRRLTARYEEYITYVCGDSVTFLREWTREERGPIHLLYLDSLDYHDPLPSELHSLREAEAALPSLAERGLALFDDTSPVSEPVEALDPSLTGKGRQSVPFLLAHGLRLEWCHHGQLLLSNNIM